MPGLRVCGGMPELQHLLNVPSAGAEVALPYLRAHRESASGLPESEVPQSGDTLCRAGNSEGRGNPDKNLSPGAGATDGFGCVEAEGRFSANPGRFQDRQNRYSAGHADDRQGAALSEWDAGGNCLRGYGFAPGGFPGRGKDVSTVDASGGASRAWR